jgi:5-methylcytosine-specific restriction protein A
MIKISCKYCGRIHDRGHICPAKPISRYGKGYNRDRSDIDRLRNTRRWRKKSIEIRKRDLGLCQVCIREMYNTVYKYTMDNIEVHHIVPITESIYKMYDNGNLISLCKYHHTMAEAGHIPRRILHDVANEQESINML